jgi:hypothetical protein
MPRGEPRAQAQVEVVQSGNPRTDGTNRPVHTLRHRSIKAAVWRNQTEKGPMFNVTVVRSFRDDAGQWRDSHSIGYDDLMNVAALMYEAHAYISSVLAEQTTAGRSGGGR